MTTIKFYIVRIIFSTNGKQQVIKKIEYIGRNDNVVVFDSYDSAKDTIENDLPANQSYQIEKFFSKSDGYLRP